MDSMDKMVEPQTSSSKAFGIMDKSFRALFIIIKFVATVTYATFKVVFKTMAVLGIIGGFTDNRRR